MHHTIHHSPHCCCFLPSISISRTRNTLPHLIPRKILLPNFTSPSTTLVLSLASGDSNNFSRGPNSPRCPRLSIVSFSTLGMARRENSNGRGGKGGGRRPPAMREVTISKALSFLLRHGGRDEGVEMDEGGWANVVDVVGLSFLRFWLSAALLEEMVSIILYDGFCSGKKYLMTILFGWYWSFTSGLLGLCFYGVQEIF